MIACATSFAATAQAGTYDVWSCKTPSGQPTSTAGWSGSSSLLYDEPADDCALGGRLSAKFTAAGGAVSGSLATRWSFTAPTGTTIDSALINRAAVARPHDRDRGAVAQAALYRGAFVDDEKHRLEDCTSAQENGCTTRKPAKVKVDATMLGLSAGCSGASGRSLCAGGDGSRASFAVDSARLTLRDEAAPTAKVGGRAVKPGPVRGSTSLKLTASDVGSGVWQAEVRLGASVVMERRTVASNRGRCKLLPGTKAFGWPVPCDRSVEATLPFATKGVKDGPQLLTVTVWDAAGNATVAISQPVSVDNDKRIQDDGTILMPAIDDPARRGLRAGAALPVAVAVATGWSRPARCARRTPAPSRSSPGSSRR